jgi:hypothetical protein
MANDDPTSRRMIFGGKQAHAAGVTEFRKPLSAEFYDFETTERAAEKEIAALAKQYPSLKTRFAEIVHEQVNDRKYHTNRHILYLMQREVSLLKGNDKVPPQSK